MHAPEQTHRRARLIAACRVAAMGGTAAYLFVLPYGHITAIRSIAFLFALLGVAWLWAMAPRRVPLLWMFGIWVAVAGLSLLSSRDAAASLDAIERDVVRSFLVFFVFYTVAARFFFYRAAVAVSAGSLGLLSALAIVAVLQHGQWTSHYVPLLGEFTTSAITILPLLVGYFFLPSREGKVLVLVAAALPLTLVAGYLTLSRAFWVVIACAALIALACYAYRRRRLQWRSAIGILALGMSALALAAAVSYDRNRSPVDFHDRAAIYSVAVQKIVSNPITGAGYGHELDKEWYARALPDLPPIYNPHNVVLGFADQMGWQGILVLIAIFGSPLVMLLPKARKLPTGAAVPCVSAIVMLGAVFLRNNADYFFLKHNLWLFFAHLGIYLGEIDRIAGATSQARWAASKSGTSASHPL